MTLTTATAAAIAAIRPEDRRRSGVDSLAHRGWVDTRPGCWRSEGFAEDLADADDAPLRPQAARAPRPRRGDGSLPVVGLILAGFLGAFGR